MRSNENIPARKAFRVALTLSLRPRGRHRLTWIELMRKQLQAINLTWEEGSQLAKDRKKWKDIDFAKGYCRHSFTGQVFIDSIKLKISNSQN